MPGAMIVAELWMPSQADGSILLANRALQRRPHEPEASTVSMADDVKEKLLAGRTNLEEVLRVLRITESSTSCARAGATAPGVHSWS